MTGTVATAVTPSKVPAQSLLRPPTDPNPKSPPGSHLPRGPDCPA
jgi:hypothetical protein